MVKLGSLRASLLAGVALAVIVPGLVRANPIGTLDIASATGGLVRVTGNVIDFFPLGSAPGELNLFNYTAGTGSFATPQPLTGLIKDLNAALQPAGPAGFPALDNFISFGVFDFMLTQIPAGVGPPCVAGSLFCSPTTLVPPGTFTPFTFTQTSSNTVAVTFAVNGIVTDATGPSNFNGLFTANLTAPPTNTVAGILGTISTPGGFVESSWSAEFTATPIPEPMEMSLIGGGLIALVGLARRRKTRA